MKKVLLVLGILLALFVSFTWWALESSGVAILETLAPDGSTRSTHVWFAEHDGALWLEAGTPVNSWYLDTQENSSVTFSADGRSGQYIASTVKEAHAHDTIRALLRQKYGIRDWWVTFIFDTSQSVAVELTPVSKVKHE